jgi:glycosidase
MEPWPIFPMVYEINTWVWLHGLSRHLGHPVILRDVPQDQLARLASYRFDAVWLMGVWERSPAARTVAREDARLRPGYQVSLPDWSIEDVVGSSFAVLDYRLDPALGGDEALAVLRERLRQLGLRLILDFIPNHLAMDHPWLAEQPERLLQADEDALARDPHTYFRLFRLQPRPKELPRGVEPRCTFQEHQRPIHGLA